MSDRFSIARERGADGAFERQTSAFRGPIEPAPGRYHLYVCAACPWSHRAMLVRELKGLQDAIGVSYVDPYRDARGWRFTGGEYTDALHGWEFLAEAYERTDPSFDGRITVPVLWDTQEGRIASNESTDIMRALQIGFDAWATRDADLLPAHLVEDTDRLGRWLYDGLNNGVYRTGFAQSQEAYEDGYARVFETLAELEQRLANRRFLLSDDAPTEIDWRAFVSLVRFDAVYVTHFRLVEHRVRDLPNLWGYTRDLYQWPGVAGTVRMDEIKRHYFTTHDELNPKGLIPPGPALDFAAPHGRGDAAARAA
jgi:putative glutathione S-transferase